MIARLTGVLDSSGPDWLIIDVNGVGYMVFASSHTIARAIASGGTISLMIETHVREDHIHLYGFADEAERDWFRLLTTVQGVGAKVGLALQSALPPDDMTAAIAAGDEVPFTTASGVGKKLATRIVTELKDKIGDIAIAFQPSAASSGTPAGSGASRDNTGAEAVSALVNLGYGRTEAFTAVSQAARRLGEGASLEDLIRDGLAELAGAEAG